MGVSWVLLYRAADSTTESRADVEKQLELMGAKRSGTFSVESLLYVPTNAELVGTKGLRQAVHICHHSEYPSTSFTLIGDNVGLTPHLVSDRNFDQLLGTMQGAYVQKPNSTLECKGQKYTVSDFVVFLGDVVMSGVSKGILIQIEFTPCVISTSCNNLILEFAHNLLGIPVGVPGHLSRFRPNQKFSPVDTAIQYAEHFVQFRKQSQMAEQHFGILGQSQINNEFTQAVVGMPMR